MLVNLLGGALWAVYNLASFNYYLLSQTPEASRARCSAIYQVVATLSLAAGAALGGLIATRWGYTAIFLGSAVGRLAAALIFARLTRSQADTPQLAAEVR